MGEREIREALRSAYAEEAEPVMGLSAASVVAAGRRSRRMRRLAGAAGAGLAVALAGAGTVVVMSGAEFAAAEPCVLAPAPQPPGETTAGRPLPPEVVQWAAASLTCHLNEEMPRLLPHARYAQVPG